MIGIIGALHVEVDILIAKLINVQKRTISGRDYYCLLYTSRCV